MSYWHFAALQDGKPVMRDGTPIILGEKYAVPDARMCYVGFHGSRRALDALGYAPGPWVSKREIMVITKQDDKVVGTTCVHIEGADATGVLRKFARMCAFDAIHLWDAPDIVVRYLKVGDESIRDAAWDAAWDAGAAARAASRAARAAARAASRAAGAAAWAAQNRRLTRMLNALLRGPNDG